MDVLPFTSTGLGAFLYVCTRTSWNVTFLFGSVMTVSSELVPERLDIIEQSKFIMWGSMKE